jgi:V8-like Glu-specific endopeptidase
MRKLRGAVVGLCLATAVALLAPAPAQAAPVAGSADVSSDRVPVFDVARGAAMASPGAAATVIADYWTPQRLASAIPAGAPPAGSVSGRPRPAPAGTPRTVTAPVAPTVADDVSAAVAFTHAEGRVFYRNPVDGRNYACSAGTVNSGKRRLVVTAGHCVHGGRGGQWMQNWAFYPGYQFGQGPAGIFPAWQLWTKNAWINDSNASYDYAIAITQNNSAGQRVVDRVGGNGLIVNPGRPFVTAIAYPGNFNNGEQQAFCQTTLTRRSIFNSDQKLNCDMRFGASGGPWLKDYSDASRLGYIVSNQSYSLNADGSGPEYGPYYDDATTSLYNAAEGASP